MIKDTDEVFIMENNKTLKEFYENHCKMCGTQRCSGVYDEDWREGCEYYVHEILHKQTLEDILAEIINK